MTEREELQMLRALVEKQKEELVAKDQIIEKQNIQIENMIQALLHARKKLYGASTEVTKQVDGQLSLFESVQELAKQLGVEQKKITVKPYTRTARKPGVRAEMLEGLPKEVEEYILPADETCSVCGSPLKVVGKRVVRTEVEFQPAKLTVKQIVQQVAKCEECGTEGSPHLNCHFQKAAVPSAAPFHFYAFPDCTGYVPEVRHGDSPVAAGKGLVSHGLGIATQRYGPLGDPVQPGMAGANLLEDSRKAGRMRGPAYG